MDGSICLHRWFHNMFTLPSFKNIFTVILFKFHVKEDVKLIKLQISYDEGNSLFDSSSLL
jgi:isocitrate dehydrogenase kinase/phosphatase